MSIVDRAKRLRQYAIDRATPARVVFHHVPKCGGTSVGRSLRQRYLLSQDTVLPEESFRAFEAFTGRDDREAMLVDVLDLREQMMLYLLYRDVRCVSLHVRFSEAAYRLFHDRYRFITILREPVERFISHYFWSHGKPAAHARIDEDFDDFLQTDRARRLGATYVEYFGGLPKEAPLAADASIASAINNLRRLDVVGRLDELPKFEADLRRCLGARIRVGHENAMKRPGLRKTVTEQQRAKVRELCLPDLAVWNACFNRADNT